VSEPPVTTAIPTGWRRQIDLRPRITRMRETTIAVVQIVVAATAAYAFARYVVGHPAPMLAGTVCISSLGLVRDARPQRVALTVVGMLVGVFVAELVVSVTGPGWWQLGVTLGLTILVARFLSAYPPFAIMAGVQSVIVMTVPTVQPFGRLLDGAIGGVAALLVTALIPRNPRHQEVRDGRAVFTALNGAATTLVHALRRGDRRRAERGLEKARAVQPHIDRWKESLDSALAVASISPWLRSQRGELRRHDRIRQSLDYATRNLRVVGRQVRYVCGDGEPQPVVADLLSELMRACEVIVASLDDVALQMPAREILVALAARLDPQATVPDASIGEQHLLVGLRPLAVDLLTATGMSSDEARAILPHI
jgi:uncharacterized membrane protein YgaE (UPF0421/DUF939 family)